MHQTNNLLPIYSLLFIFFSSYGCEKLMLENKTDQIIHAMTLACANDSHQVRHQSIPAQTKSALLINISSQFALYTDGVTDLYNSTYFNLERIADITCTQRSITIKKYNHPHIETSDKIEWQLDDKNIVVMLKHKD